MAYQNFTKHTFTLVDKDGKELAYVSSRTFTQGDCEINKMKESFKDFNPRIIYKKK